MEIRAKTTTSTFLQVRMNIKLEKDEFWKFKEDLDVLKLVKGDYLVAVQVQGKHVDIRNKSAGEVNQLITDALKEKNIVFRVVKKDHPNAEKYLQLKGVRYFSMISFH